MVVFQLGEEMRCVMVDGTFAGCESHDEKKKGALRADPRSSRSALSMPQDHYDLGFSLVMMWGDQYWRAGLDIEGCSSIEKLEIGRSRGLERGDARLGGAYLAKVS